MINLITVCLERDRDWIAKWGTEEEGGGAHTHRASPRALLFHFAHLLSFLPFPATISWPPREERKTYRTRQANI